MARLPTAEELGSSPAIKSGGVANVRTPDVSGINDIAAGISAVGQAVAEVKDYDDRVRAEDAQNQLQQTMLDLSNGDNGFKRIKSRGVVDRPVYKEYNEQFDSAVDNISKSLGNDSQREYFRRRADVQKLRFNTDLTNHIQSERDTYTKQAIESGIALETQTAGEQWNEPGTVALSIERSKRLVDLQSDINGLPNAARKALKLKAESDIHLNVIEQAVANDQPEYAKAYFEKNQKGVDATKYDEIKDLIRKTEIKVLSQDVADDIMAEDLSEEDALKKIRKKYKGDEEKAIVDSVKTRYREQQDAKKQSQSDATDQAREIYANGVDQGVSDPYKLIPQNILDDMNPQARIILQKEASGTKYPSGGPDYYQLKVLARDDPEAFKKENVFNYRLSDADRKEIIKLQTDPIEIDYFASQSQIVDQGVAGIGLDPKDKLKDNNDGERVRAFYNRIKQEQENYQRSTGKKMDDKALQELVDRMSIKVIRERSGLRWNLPGGEIMNAPLIPIWPTSDTPVAEMEIEGIPNDLLDDLAKAVKESGHPVTKENIQKLYNAAR